LAQYSLTKEIFLGNLAEGAVYIIMGAPNAGKDVQAERLAEKIGAKHLSSGALLREDNDPRLMAIMARGDLVPEEDFRRIIRDAVAKVPAAQPIVLAGVAKKPGEAEWLLEHLPEAGRSITGVVLLEIDREVSHERSMKRGRFDDDPAVQDERWQRYYEETLRSMEVFDKAGLLVKVDGGGTPDEVTSLIMAALGL
jgi:adenylate kinase